MNNKESFMSTGFVQIFGSVLKVVRVKSLSEVCIAGWGCILWDICQYSHIYCSKLAGPNYSAHVTQP